MKRIAIAVFVMLFASLATFGLRSNHKNQVGSSEPRLKVTTREAAYILRVGFDATGPEIQRAVAEINAQLPIVTVANWDARKVKEASNFLAVALGNSTRQK